MFIFLVYNSGCSSSKSSDINTLSQKEKKEGWELLFDGKSLDNRKTFNGGEVTGWKIIDGVLHNSGVESDHGGDIVTEKEFKDSELYLEWKIAPESNSCVFFHVREGITDAIYETEPTFFQGKPEKKPLRGKYCLF